MPEGVGYRSEARGQSPDWCEIVATIRRRIEADSILIQQMASVQARYQGDYTMPYLVDQPDLNLPPMAPAIITDAVENLGNRASSVFPGFNTPQLRKGEQGIGSKEWAAIRRQTLNATWTDSKGRLVLRRGCKQLVGYDSTTFVVEPKYHPRDTDLDGVKIKVRSPLTTYPDQREAEDFGRPENVGFIFERSAPWLRARYPWLTQEQGGPIAASDERRWRLCEWKDPHNTITGLLEPIETDTVWDPMAFPAERLEIASFENKILSGPAVVCPTRINLDKLGSRLAHVTGIADLMSQLLLLEILATESQIYPDRYVVGVQGQTPTIISHGGQWQPGRTGNINLLKNAASIGALNTPPPPQSQQMIDTLERMARQHSHDVPAFRGETYGSLRTGRGLDSMMGAAVDPVIQEIHETLEAALVEVNSVALETWKEHWGGRTFSLYTGSASALHQFELEPAKHIETTRNVVSYAIPGADIQAVTVQLGQLLATKGMSLHTFRIRHPWIDDPEMEARLTDEESLEEALLQGILQQVGAGTMPLVYVAHIEKFRKTEPDIIEAIIKADAAMAKEQAEMQAAEAPPDPTDPANMPGLAAGPEMLTPPGLPPGGPMEVSPAIGPNEDQAGLKRLINAVTGGASLVGQ